MQKLKKKPAAAPAHRGKKAFQTQKYKKVPFALKFQKKMKHIKIVQSSKKTAAAPAHRLKKAFQKKQLSFDQE